MFFIVGTILIIYSLLIIAFTIGWFLNYIQKPNLSYFSKISVVVAVRNEQQNINNLLNCLYKQSFNNFEVILINDHSSDDTLYIIKDFIKNHLFFDLKIYTLPPDLQGKKAAINFGFKQVTGSIIFTTDADCIMTPFWIESMLSLLTNKVKLVAGPVVFSKQKGVISKLFSLEFISLVSSGAGAIGINHPIYCNAANLCFKKEIIAEIDLNSDIASGDDVFLIHSLKKFNDSKIKFAQCPNAIVETNAPLTFNAFFMQRLRWASKSKNYKDFDSIFVSLIVFLANLSLFINIILAIFDYSFIYSCLLLFILKLVVDFILLIPATSFFNRKKLLLFVVPLQLLYSFYIIIVGILALFMPYKWKGRVYKR